MAAPTDFSSLMRTHPEVKSTILHHAVHGSGGLSRLLNLRSLSSSMKLVVDTPLLSRMPCVFSDTVVSVGGRRQAGPDHNGRSVIENLQQLADFPPPPAVTSLNLNFTYPPPLPAETDVEIFNAFVDKWRRIVQWIRIDSLELPLSRDESALFTHTELSSVHLTSLAMKLPRRSTEAPLELPDFFTRVRSLTVRFCLLPQEASLRLFTMLNANANLKTLKISVVTAEEDQLLGGIIYSRRNDVDFWLTVAVSVLPGIGDPSDGDTLSRRILASSSDILLVDMVPEAFKWMVERLQMPERLRLVGKIQSVRFWRRSRLILLEDFPSLLYLGRIRFQEEATREPLPQSLLVLRILVCQRSGFNFLFSPRNLVHLSVEFGDYDLDLNFLAVSIDSLSLTCKSLKHLGVYCKAIVRGQRRITKYPGPMIALTSLDFHCDPVCPSLRMICLVNILQVPNLPRLKTLTMTSFTPDEVRFRQPALTERRTVRLIVNGPSAQVIHSVQIRNRFISPENRALAEPVYAPLLAVAAENARRFQANQFDAEKKMEHHHFSEFCDTYAHPPEPPYYV